SDPAFSTALLSSCLHPETSSLRTRTFRRDDPLETAARRMQGVHTRWGGEFLRWRDWLSHEPLWPYSGPPPQSTWSWTPAECCKCRRSIPETGFRRGELEARFFWRTSRRRYQPK